jgi:hypothetical protein
VRSSIRPHQQRADSRDDQRRRFCGGILLFDRDQAIKGEKAVREDLAFEVQMSAIGARDRVSGVFWVVTRPVEASYSPRKALSGSIFANLRAGI